MPEPTGTLPKSHAPMGWNSYDCFGSAVTEAEVRANAEVLAHELLPHGFDTLVVDYCWFHPSPGACANPNQIEGFQPLLAIDADHRLLPAPERFPSAAGGLGFKPLADYIHSLGLRFGIHIMRGFPRQALYPDFPTSSGLFPSRIADPESTCSWLNLMCGVRPGPEGQAYYDSLFQLYAQWGVDYIKADDCTFPYHADEIEMIDRARRHCGRHITLSLSPGACPLDQAAHVAQHADLWRISPDFWDTWPHLRRAFDLCRAWAPYRTAGGGPDPDMLPIGRLSRRGPCGPERESRYTAAEQRTLLTLWSLFGAPLFIGGDLTLMDQTTSDLLRHPSLRRCRALPSPAECIRHDATWSVWEGRDSAGRLWGVFNLSDHPAELPLPPDVDEAKSLRILFPDKSLLKRGTSRLVLPHDCLLVECEAVAQTP